MLAGCMVAAVLPVAEEAATLAALMEDERAAEQTVAPGWVARESGTKRMPSNQSQAAGANRSQRTRNMLRW